MEALPIVAFILFLFLPFLGLLAYMMRKRYQASWRGQVIRKYVETITDYENNTFTTYYLEIKTDDGRVIPFDVTEERYDSWQVGDRLEKKAHEYHPRRVG